MKWYESPVDKCDPYQLKPPYDNIWVGPDPRDGMTPETAKSYQAIVNVSSTRCSVFEPAFLGQAMYWYPIIEMGRWSLGYLLWLKEIMDFHHSQGHKIYLHCHAGAFRSPSAAVLWLQSRGHSDQEAIEIGSRRGSDSALYRIQKNHGNIPKRKDQLFEMFRKQQKDVDSRGRGTLCIEGILTYGMFDPWDHEIMSGKYRRWHILHHYLWFYYEPKYWLKDKYSKFKGWAFDRTGYYTEGCGTYIYRRKNFWEMPRNAEPENINTDIVYGSHYDLKSRTFIKN